MENTPASNLVFLLDVSGSMNDPNKLPLLKSSFGLLVDQLDQDDRIAIVVYAGASGLILPPTTCDQKETILMALDNLSAGGSTAGAEGIQLAYKTARESFISEGNNRIILATDGDFNVGVSSDAELQRLVEKNREDGIFLSIFGFGTGNLQDAKMEKMADNGNGNYYYIDSMFEAQKVLVSEIGGTLHVIAKDVKIQVEFNPAKVHSYRLIGYENRLLEEEDFDNDKKDAGELGAGHTVTALYEIVPNALDAPVPVTEYRYQSVKVNDGAYNSSEIGNLKLRCKPPTGTVSLLTEIPLIDSHLALGDTEDYFRFSAAVAEFGMLLRDSEYKGNSSYEQVLALAAGAKGADEHGYRQEFIKLVKIAESLASTSVSTGK
jgi:Ca-activated chloride channel homolog